MKYSWFEALVLVLGSIAIVAGMFIGAPVQHQPAEVVAQLLIIVVLAGAVHWGRNGGFVTALLATAIYVFVRLPLLTTEGLASDALVLIAIRVLTYAVVGIAGGEVAGRIKYVMARLENSALVDQTTGAYSACHAAKSITSALAAWDRYGTPYSLVLLTVNPTFFQGLRPKRYRSMMHQLAAALRNDIRLVDDLAFGLGTTFLVLLPNTEHPGATVVAERISTLAADHLGAESSVIRVEALSCSHDRARLADLALQLMPADSPLYERCVPPSSTIERQSTSPAERRGAGASEAESAASAE